MEGFDPKFRDLPDYILRVTEEVWEGRGIAALRNYYAATMALRSPPSVVVGNEKVIAATLATLAEFPDRKLLGEDVIWSGDEHDGFLSSHRLLSSATHLGHGAYGSATGKTVRYRVIADCAVKNNQICDEWLIRDQGAIVRQLGLQPQEYVFEQFEREGSRLRHTRPLRPDSDVEGDYRGRGNDNEFGQRYADLLNRIMRADLAAVPQVYDRAVQIETPGGATGHGRDAADRFWVGLRSAFPSARFEIHHVIGREDPMMPPRAALRWSLWGNHDGFGLFGEPSGAMVYVMGISHAEFGPRGLRREWVLFDEVAIWTQILSEFE